MGLGVFLDVGFWGFLGVGFVNVCGFGLFLPLPSCGSLFAVVF